MGVAPVGTNRAANRRRTIVAAAAVAVILATLLGYAWLNRWGPLAVVPNISGDMAANGGTLVITDRCTFLRNSGANLLLIWPESRTTWDQVGRTITFRNRDDSVVTVRHGDAIAVGGSEGSLGGAPERVWVVRPHPTCAPTGTWGLNTVRLAEASAATSSS